MLKEKLSIERRKAVMITADFTAPTTESYAMAWLRLCNNAREYKDIIWRIENDSGNRVYVWCDPKYKETVIEFLTGIVYYYQEDKGPTSVGKVIEAEDVTVGFPVYEYESTCSSHEEQWGFDIDNSIMFWGAVKEIFY